MKILLPQTSIFNPSRLTPQTSPRPEQNNSSLINRAIPTEDTFIHRPPAPAANLHFTGKQSRKPDDEALFQQFPTSFQSILQAAASKALEVADPQLKAEHVVWAAIHTLDSLAGWSNTPSRGSRQANKEREHQAAQLAQMLMPDHPHLTPEQVANVMRPLAEELAGHFTSGMEIDEPINLEIHRPLKQAMKSALKAEAEGFEQAPNALLRKILWQVPPVHSFAPLANSARSSVQNLQHLENAPSVIHDAMMSSDDEGSINTPLEPNNWDAFEDRLKEKAPAVARWVKSSSRHPNRSIYTDAKLPPLCQVVASGVEAAHLELPISQRRRPTGHSRERNQPLKNSLSAIISKTLETKEALSMDRSFLGSILERYKKTLQTLHVPLSAAEVQEQALRTRQVLVRFIDQPGREDYSLEAFVAFLKDPLAAAKPGVPPEHAEVGRLLTQLQDEASDTRIPQMAQFEKSVPSLIKYGTNMVRQGIKNQWPHILLRREATDRMLAMLGTGGERTNILLNSASGEGKTFAVRGLAKRIANNDVPPTLTGTQMVELNVGAIISGNDFQEDMEETLQEIFKQLNKYLNDNPQRKVVVFIDEIHRIGEMLDSMKASGILEKKNLSFIGATTPEDWRKSPLYKDRAFQGRFQELALPSFNRDEKLSILGHSGTKLAKKSGVSISPELLEQSLIQAVAKWPENTLRHAIDLMALSVSLAKSPPLELATLKDNLQKKELWLDTLKAQKTLKGRFTRQMTEVQSEVHTLKNQIQDMEHNAKNLQETIPLKDKHLRQAMAVLTGERIGVLSQDELSKLRQAKAVMSRYIVGQPEALSTIEEGLREIAVRQKTGGVRNRPIASMLLCGPTGVGKTEVAKVISKEFMNNNFLRLDMSDYMNDHEVSRLMGSPPGYVGHENGGLVDQIRNTPNSVIVFDEIEKAHPNIFNVLLPILEEGELRDNQGQIVSFRNAIIMLTSNLNNQQITELLMKNRQNTLTGHGKQKDPTLAMREMETQMRHLLTANAEEGRPGFRPEHLGRLDYVIPFSPLTKRHVSDILDIRLREMNQEPLLKDNNLEVILSDQARARLVNLTAASSLPKATPVGAGLLEMYAKAPTAQTTAQDSDQDDTPLQGGARDVRMNFDRFVNKTVFTDLTFDPKLADLENAKLIVDYDPEAQAFKVKAAPIQ